MKIVINFKNGTRKDIISVDEEINFIFNQLEKGKDILTNTLHARRQEIESYHIEEENK